MIESSWKIIAASVAGTSHAAKNNLCQDSFAWQIVSIREPVLIIVVSDGAGSAKSGGEGAKITCQTMMREIHTVVKENDSVIQITRDHVLEWIKLLQTQFEILAASEKLEIKDFACTLLAAIIQAEAATFLQIGDGGMVYAEAANAPDEFHLIFEPQQGEYANSTNFVTDKDAPDVLQFEILEKKIDEIAIFTDGLQRVALDFAAKTAHPPFFRPMFAPLRSFSFSDELLPEKLEKLQKQLFAFLDSPKINERTDDDKTLILASRKIL